MNRWSPERRRQVALLAVGTLGAVAVIWLGLVSTLQALLKTRQTRLDSEQAKLNLALKGNQLASQYENEVKANLQALQALELQMARGDIYRWAINRTAELADRHDLTVTPPQPPRLGEAEAPPAVPYKAGAYSFGGYGYFQNIGAFLADFENSSPFIRLKGLTVQTIAPGFAASRDAEKLSFQIEFVTLVTTNTFAP
jgi:hypothetical protein